MGRQSGSNCVVLEDQKFACLNFVDRDGKPHEGHPGHHLKVKKLPGYGGSTVSAWYVSGPRKVPFRIQAMQDPGCYRCVPKGRRGGGMGDFLLQRVYGGFTMTILSNPKFRAHF